MDGIQRCAISNEEIPGDINTYRKVLDGVTMTKSVLKHMWNIDGNLEEALGKPTASCIPLRIDWYATFVLMYWTLVPHTDTLLYITRALMTWKKKGKNVKPRQIIDYDTYKYVFIPLKLEGMPINRRTALSSQPGIYTAPYNDFPTINLTLHPYVALVHAREAFRKFGLINLTNDQLQVDNNIQRIWSLWKALEDY